MVSFKTLEEDRTLYFILMKRMNYGEHRYSMNPLKWWEENINSMYMIMLAMHVHVHRKGSLINLLLLAFHNLCGK